MNRTIKFRAWDSKQKKYIDEVYPKEYMFESDCWDVPDYGDMCEALSFFPKNPMGPTFDGRIIYEQFTGFKDKSGKEIYEGDIIEGNGINANGLLGKTSIIFEYGSFMESKYKYNLSSIAGNNYRDYVLYNFEIIGNIHENPELLK